MAINSRNKGNRAERLVAALLKEWTGKDFSRTPSSGGLNWKSSNSKGDIVCTTEGHYFPMCIEVKHHQKTDFNEILVPSKKKPKILEFWAQCKRDAEKAGKTPLLFFKYNNLPKEFFFVAISHETYKKALAQKDTGFNTPMFLVKTEVGEVICITTSTTFFKLNYRKLRKALKR